MIINEYKFPSLKWVGNKIENTYPSLYEHLLTLHTLIKDHRYRIIMYDKVQSFLLFEEVCIETINRCNGSCSFCPVNKITDTRKFHLMERELFYSIINQLQEINYKKTISLFCNNESLLDNRIFEFAEYTKNKLPEAFICINTNGILLTPEKFYKLIPNLNLLIINNYNNKLELNENIKQIHEICINNKEYDNKVWITIRKQNEILTSRSGQAKNRKITNSLSSSCIYPFMQIAIRSDGKVNLCCNDALGEETLGDVNKESLIEIWDGVKHTEIKQKMLKNRKLLPLCKKCDTIIIPADLR